MLRGKILDPYYVVIWFDSFTGLEELKNKMCLYT